MSPEDKNRGLRKDLLIAAAMVMSGLAVFGVSLTLYAQNESVAQTAPSQSAPTVPTGKDDGPAESKPGGTRPTTPAPEPARPDAEARKQGAQPALPPAPAEQVAPPIKSK